MAWRLLNNLTVNNLSKGRTLLLHLGILLSALSLTAPAHASIQGGKPELADLALFALGVTGLLIGHFTTRRLPPGK